ncbi:hypothetical protein A2961_05025 [Candidatus Woesebacteria bacterium RIFCSPLOWO2_01_FULL_39_21]|uniref:Uncharacterized protein n=1 Tax=Candidatus Woesebacteria bacterium RIFCSPLOWO2_01_FULL_39_21 TaxID=1802519 RepID=A0A1F8BDH9_9BACT|nr:MAG: hypothetical protein A2691_03400 [Candidatus Woesebacteria bacterium RIFCSPHIGHO2_01_FULL_39_23]OGM62106.1 MAG: hypothetical protein A2961_05025 [Candidatus Woesebacteria bacterium RIFCSPLOWO2_01_FULL_39_21]
MIFNIIKTPLSLLCFKKSMKTKPLYQKDHFIIIDKRYIWIFEASQSLEYPVWLTDYEKRSNPTDVKNVLINKG